MAQPILWPKMTSGANLDKKTRRGATLGANLIKETRRGATHTLTYNDLRS